jgi:epoxide hydrolase 4
MEAAKPTRSGSSGSHEAYAEINGVRLHYLEQGEDPLILFLHGFPDCWYSWNKFLPAFATDHRAVAVDMRGFNLSSMPEALDAYQVPVLVEDIRGLIEKLGATQCTLVGHDWGGVIAWHFAYAHPNLLDKLIILNAPHPAIFARELASNPDQQKASSYFILFSTPAAEAVLSQNEFALPQQVVFAGGWSTEADRQNYLDCWRRGLTGGLNYYRAAAVGSLLSGAAPSARQFPLPKSKLTVPTLVIWGEKDIALLTGNLEGLDQYVETLQIHRIPHAGHFVQHEQPAEVIASIRRFLAHSA